MPNDIETNFKYTEVDSNVLERYDINEDKKHYMIKFAYKPDTLHTVPDDNMLYPAVLRLYNNNFIPELYLITSDGDTYKYYSNDWHTKKMGEWVGNYNWRTRVIRLCKAPIYLEDDGTYTDYYSLTEVRPPIEDEDPC